jgi:hypothetical protein
MQTSAPLPPVSAQVGGAEGSGEVELALIEVDGDHRGRPGEDRPRHRSAANPPAAEHGDRVPVADLTGEHGCTETGHHAAAEEADRLGARRRVDLRALAGGDEGLLGEGADPECGRELGAVEERHLLRRVVRRKAVLGTPAPTGPALAADGTPVEDNEVTGPH